MAAMDENACHPSPAAACRQLERQRGLILGVANESSIAWGCARSAHQRGARLVLSCLNKKAAIVVSPLAQRLAAPLLECNYERRGSLQALVAQAVQHLGGLDLVVHSIAWAPLTELRGRVVACSAPGFLRAMHISCHSFAELARLCEPHMPHGGTLVTMSFLGEDEAVPHYGLMGPVEAALESLVRYIALELGPLGVRVHAVSPGPVPTRAAAGLADFGHLMAHAEKASPLRRSVTLSEIGDFVAFLAGPEATGMTGQTLYVDAGMHAVR